MVGSNEKGYFPYTPSTNLLYRLNEAIDILREEGLENVFAGHADHGAAVKFWGLEVLCAKQGQESGVLTVVLMAYCYSVDSFRASTLENFDVSIGKGLSNVSDKVSRIDHLGDFNHFLSVAT